MTIKDYVEADKESLANASRAELVAWANTHGIDNRSAWGRYKVALREVVGVDFDALRNAERGARATALAGSATHRLVLFTDAKASKSRFAVCGPDREVVWYGRFFDDDPDFNGEQSSGEMAVAKKAIWLASKVAERLGAVVALELRVDAEWLTWANATDGRGGKARALANTAERLGVALCVTHIPGTENPADKWTVADGYQRWQDAFEHLCEQVEPNSGQEAQQNDGE
ncbi:MAG: hypothetical protein ACYCS4_07955 [Acidimicrobiales bacterium]